MTHFCKVSIIIPTYNRADVLPMAIDSILAQTYKNYEVIIVDDGSTDNTKDILKHYLKKPNVHYIYQDNKKQAAARNTGIRCSKGEYIAFLDSDDLWYPEKLGLQVRILDKNNDAGMVYSNQMLIDNSLNNKGVKYSPKILKSGNIFKELLLRKFYCSLPTVLIRKSVLDDVGLLDEGLRNALEDWELTLRVTRKYKVACIDKPLLKRRIHDEATENYFEIRINNHQAILEKYLNNNKILPASFINLVWRKTYFSWGHSYLINYRYWKAFKCFSQSLLKGNCLASGAMLLCAFGPTGKRIFVNLVKLKHK